MNFEILRGLFYLKLFAGQILTDLLWMIGWDKVLMEINCFGKTLYSDHLFFFSGYGNSEKHSKYYIFRFLTS